MATPSYRNLTTPNFTLTLPAPYIAQIEVNRPSKLNAYTTEMFFTLGKIFHTLSRDPDVRVIILTAKGEKAFTAGLDVSVAAKEGPLSLVFGEGGKGDGKGDKGEGEGEEKDVARKAWELRRHIKEIQKPVSEIEGCEKPVICVVSYFFFCFFFPKKRMNTLTNNMIIICVEKKFRCTAYPTAPQSTFPPAATSASVHATPSSASAKSPSDSPRIWAHSRVSHKQVFR